MFLYQLDKNRHFFITDCIIFLYHISSIKIRHSVSHAHINPAHENILSEINPEGSIENMLQSLIFLIRLLTPSIAATE